MTIIVCPLSALDHVVETRAPSHLISLLGSDHMIGPHPALRRDRHLRLAMDDIERPMPGFAAPSARMVEDIVAFAEGWDGAAPMVVHCLAGISRSTASAFVIACARNPGVDEDVIARALRRAGPHAQPNRRIVALADDVLDRRGRMLEAVEAMDAGVFLGEGMPFDLAAKH